MTDGLVDQALRSTFRLSGADAARLRRLTRSAGLDAENVVSRLAIATSAVAAPADDPSVVDRHGPGEGRVKEIKGSVLLGRPRQAAALLALMMRTAPPCGMETYRAAVEWHWSRGLTLVERDAPGGDVIRLLTRELTASVSRSTRATRRRGGLGLGARDELAAAVARRYPRWPTEVCRLVAMAARLDESRIDETASLFAQQAHCLSSAGRVKEATALRVLHEHWGVDRIGLTQADRDLLATVVKGDPFPLGTGDSGPFLVRLGLLRMENGRYAASTRARTLYEEGQA
jgi:hypothetical protein